MFSDIYLYLVSIMMLLITLRSTVWKSIGGYHCLLSHSVCCFTNVILINSTEYMNNDNAVFDCLNSHNHVVS